jgi:hypothetical protein
MTKAGDPASERARSLAPHAAQASLAATARAVRAAVAGPQFCLDRELFSLRAV